MMGGLLACVEPSPPAHPATVRELRITVDSVTTLAGTLTRPVASKPAPVGAVLLLSGSGPQNRDGARIELPGYQPWRDVREALLDVGLAVVQVDDRGTNASTGQFAGATTDDFARDAAAVVRWARQQPDIDGERLAIVGHSEGAVVALLVARDDPAVAALVLLGAPARAGREIARWQRQQLVTSDQARWPAAARRDVLAAADANAESLASRDPWLRRWFALDPRSVAREVRTPVLLLHGDVDRQVPPAHAGELASVLRDAGASPVLVKALRHTNHLLLPDHDGDPEGYVRLADQRVRREACEAIAEFLRVRLATTRDGASMPFPRGKTAASRGKAH